MADQFMSFQKYLVTFKDGACVVSAPDPHTAMGLASQQYPDSGEMHVYRATKDDLRLMAMPKPPKAKRKKVETALLPFTEFTYLGGLEEEKYLL